MTYTIDYTYLGYIARATSLRKARKLAVELRDDSDRGSITVYRDGVAILAWSLSPEDGRWHRVNV